MTSSENKKNLIHMLIDELNKDNLPQKILQPYINHVFQIVQPYYIIHIVLQIVIIALLLFIIYCLCKNKNLIPQ
jgi:hypothetical protein